MTLEPDLVAAPKVVLKGQELQKDKGDPAVRTASKNTWLTPFADAWIKQYQGSPNYGLLAKALKPLVDAHGEALVLEHWNTYLLETPGRFASPRRFAETFGEWDRRKADRREGPRRASDLTAPFPDETPDAYLARVGSAG